MTISYDDLSNSLVVTFDEKPLDESDGRALDKYGDVQFSDGWNAGYLDARRQIMQLLDDGSECGTAAIDAIEGRQ